MKGKQQPSIRDPGFSGFCVPCRRLRGNDTPGPLSCASQSPGNGAQRAEHPGPVNPSLAPQTPWSGFHRGGGYRFKAAQRGCESDFIEYHHTGPSFRVLASGSCRHAQEGPACQPWSLVDSKEKSCLGPHNPERAEQDIPAQPRCTWLLKARGWVWGACAHRGNTSSAAPAKQTRHCRSLQPRSRRGLTRPWTSSGRVIPEQLFLQKNNVEIQQKADLVLLPSNTAPHTAAHTCPGSTHFTHITSQIGAAITLTGRKAN